MSGLALRPGGRRAIVAIAAAVALTAATLLGAVPAQAVDGANGLIYSDPSTTTTPADYTRVITLRHNGSANGTMLATFEDNVTATTAYFPIYKSTNNGASWSFVTNVADTHYGYGNRQEPSLYELPQAVGEFAGHAFPLLCVADPQLGLRLEPNLPVPALRAAHLPPNRLGPGGDRVMGEFNRHRRGRGSAGQQGRIVWLHG